MKLDVWHYLLNVYTMFQIDTSKHAENKPGKLHRIENAQKNRQNSENINSAKKGYNVAKYTAAYLHTKFQEFTMIYKATIVKIEFFCCKLGQSDPIVMKLTLDMSCHLLNAYTKF